MSEQYVTLSTLGEIREQIPPGNYNVKIRDITAKQSKNDKPMLEVIYQVVEGDNEGGEVKEWFSLSGKRSDKDGKYYYAGVLAIRELLSRIGAPLSRDFQFPLDPVQARKVLGKGVQGKILQAKIFEKSYEKDGETKKGTGIKIVGVKPAPKVEASEEEEIEL